MKSLISRYDVSENSVRLAPVNLWNLPKALWISKKAFQDEWILVWLTYFWHIGRAHSLPPLVNMVRRRCLRFAFEGRTVGTIDILSTKIHDPDTRWVILDTEVAISGDAFAAFLAELMPDCRLALLQTPNRADFLEQVEAINYEGYLPGCMGTRLYIYSFRRERVSKTSSRGFSAISKDCNEPDIHAEFYLLYRKGRAFGITGLYTTGFWPHIGWGGWGAIRHSSARLHTVIAALAATEDLARKRGQEWFCIETSSAPQYHSASKMYEHYGLRRLLNVEDFFRERGDSRRGENYIVYGKKVTSE